MGKIRLGIFVVAIIAAISRQALQPSLNEQIADECRKANVNCPKMIDDVTRLDGCVAGDKRMTFNYTIMTYSKFTSEEKEALKTNLQPMTAAQNRSNRDVKKALDAGVTLTYVYHDEKGAVVVQFDVAGG